MTNLHTKCLQNAVDCCLFHAIRFALDISATRSVAILRNEVALAVATELNSMIVAPFPEIPKSSFLPVQAVFSARRDLRLQTGNSSQNVCNKTFECRIGLDLAAQNAYRYTLSRNYRCYAMSTALSETVQSVISLSLGDDLPLNPKQR